MAKQVRWKCPICDDGLLAPTRPRRNDVRRYCLPCSTKSGRLVDRVAPSLEKKREKRTAIVQQKNKDKRVRVAKKLQPQKERMKRTKQRQAIFEKEALFAHAEGAQFGAATAMIAGLFEPSNLG